MFSMAQFCKKLYRLQVADKFCEGFGGLTIVINKATVSTVVLQSWRIFLTRHMSCTQCDTTKYMSELEHKKEHTERLMCPV